jgi:hypothetical protein
MAGTGVLMAVLLVVSLILLALLLSVVGPAGAALIAPFVVYYVFWFVRLMIDPFPRVLAIQILVWFLLALYLIVGTFGVDVQEKRVNSFYTTVAAADAALLIAASFQSGWARRVLALEGLVFVAVWALAVSLICCFVALGRGADSTVLFALTVVGPAAGIVLVGVGVVRQLAPDLLPAWGLGVTGQLVGEELGRHDWMVVKAWANRRPFRYSLKATRGEERLYVVVKEPPGSFAPLQLTPDEWRWANKHREYYVLAVVDFFGSDELRTWYVTDPTAPARPIERAISDHVAGAQRRRRPVPPELPRAWLEPRAVEARLLGRKDRVWPFVRYAAG